MPYAYPRRRNQPVAAKSLLPDRDKETGKASLPPLSPVLSPGSYSASSYEIMEASVFRKPSRVSESTKQLSKWAEIVRYEGLLCS